MIKINSADGQFQEGDPFLGVEGTIVTPLWLNHVQGEILTLLSAAGIAVNSDKTDQLYASLKKLFAPVENQTQAPGDRTAKTATDRFVADALGAWVIIDCTGNQDINLSQPQWGAAILILTGTPTANINLILPAQGDQHKVFNKCSGIFAVTVKPVGGAGVVVPFGFAFSVFYDGVDIRAVDAPDPSAAAIIYFLAG